MEYKIVYNVTVKVTHAIAAEWRIWMLREHMPELLKTNCFVGAKMYRVLDIDDTDGPTFCAQYFCENRSQYDNYLAQHAAHFKNESIQKWGEQALAFRSLLEVQL